ncbi:universal stress protein [Actinotalea sp. BY-33]|uniref:Universal stress protein n=1 Tax=Actinotalea soli TaxID=2819234 RepID=A0A939RSH9_9CELL|nr:universal stress protein [Actinotalea soli]MBO1751357.1 universal stress protein [Actinotalea soli]
MSRTIIVGVEGGTSSHDAVLWAAHAAHDRGEELVLVHATGFPTIAVELYDDAVQQGARNLLAQEAQRVREAVPIVPRIVLDPRRPAHALCDRSHDADLVVVGSHPLTPLERVIIGSLSYQVAAGSFCPVIVVPHLPDPSATRVVVGVDGSPDSVAAVAFAAAEADRAGAELHVVHTWEQPAVYVSVEYLAGGFDEQMIENEQVVLAESVAGLAEQYPDLVVEQHLVQGQPATALIEAAQGARLLVVGTHGRHGVARMLLGSVAHTVVLHAPCPVAVVRIR